MDKESAGKGSEAKNSSDKGTETKGASIQGRSGASPVGQNPAESSPGTKGAAPQGRTGGNLGGENPGGKAPETKGAEGKSPGLQGRAAGSPLEKPPTAVAAPGKGVGGISAVSKTPIEGSPFAAQITALQAAFTQFHERSQMPEITHEVSDIEGRVLTLPKEIEAIRSQGYAYRSYLENKAEVLRERWDEMKQRVHGAIDEDVADLRDEIRALETQIQALDATATEADIQTRSGGLSSLNDKFDAAEQRIRSMYSSLKNDVQSTFQQITEINWYLEQKAEASFDFLAGESLFMAAQAEWIASGRGKDDPDGILYLTDQRLIFEQKEKTGKKLGIFGGKQEQEIEWELPLNSINSVEAENKGLFGGKDMLMFSTSSGQHRQITVEVKGGVDCKFWQKQIQRMVSGDVNNERAIEPDPEMIEKLRQAPTACHVCGGTLPRLIAGQNQVTCDYCASVIRL